jgi:hypothetical protein
MGTDRLLHPALFLLVMVPTGLAQSVREAPPVSKPPTTGGHESSPDTLGMPFVDRIVRDVERKYKVVVIKVQERENNGRRLLVFRLYNEETGTVRILRIDAETGKEL